MYINHYITKIRYYTTQKIDDADACSWQDSPALSIERDIDHAAQRILRAKTEPETVERALDLTTAEHRRNRLVAEANARFIESGIKIEDVYESLAE